MKSKPLRLGVFDSGLGGLTVVKEIKKLIPNIPILYLGDTARVPYGTRSKETIQKFAEEDTKFLVSKNVSLIVVACNTVSSQALDIVKKNSNVPVFDVISPAIKKALKTTKTGKIGLVGTRATVGSDAYKEISLRAHATMLVPLVEEGFIKGKEVNLFIKKYFTPFVGKVDTLILGCTHYPILKDEIQKFLKSKIKLVDPAVEISKEILEYLKKKQIKSEGRIQKDKYYLTDLNERFLETANKFLRKNILNDLERIDL